MVVCCVSCRVVWFASGRDAGVLRVSNAGDVGGRARAGAAGHELRVPRQVHPDRRPAGPRQGRPRYYPLSPPNPLLGSARLELKAMRVRWCVCGVRVRLAELGAGRDWLYGLRERAVSRERAQKELTSLLVIRSFPFPLPVCRVLCLTIACCVCAGRGQEGGRLRVPRLARQARRDSRRHPRPADRFVAHARHLPHTPL
jgi:hypothetical protein